MLFAKFISAICLILSLTSPSLPNPDSIFNMIEKSQASYEAQWEAIETVMRDYPILVQEEKYQRAYRFASLIGDTDSKFKSDIFFNANRYYTSK